MTTGTSAGWLQSEVLMMNEIITQLLECDASTCEIAAVAADKWKQLDAGLKPIIGCRGLDAIYTHGAQLTAEDFPWLHVVDAHMRPFAGFEWLEAQLAKQEPEIAVAANATFYNNVCDLLASLVGAPLTERLLTSIFGGEESETISEALLPYEPARAQIRPQNF